MFFYKFFILLFINMDPVKKEIYDFVDVWLLGYRKIDDTIYLRPYKKKKMKGRSKK